jgi:CheY-like chemotaxis protein
VEDDSGDEFFILRALKSVNLESRAVIVRDGEEATDYIFKTGRYQERPSTLDPKVIMLDLCLPKVAGLEVLRLVKEDERTRQIPVVVMTSSDSKFDVDRCYELGANSVFRKSTIIEEFRESLAIAVTYWTQINVHRSDDLMRSGTAVTHGS